MEKVDILLNAVLNCTRDTMIILDPHLKVIHSNQACSNIGGIYKCLLKAGDDVRKAFPETLSEQLLTALEKAIKGETTVFEAEVVATNSPIWIKCRVSPIYDESKKLLWICLNAEDIDQQKKVELSLLESVDKFKKIIESAPNPIIIVDEEMRIKMVNKEVTVVFGYEPQDLVENSINILIPDRFHKSHLQHQKRYLENGEPIRMGTNRQTPARKKMAKKSLLKLGLTRSRSPKKDL